MDQERVGLQSAEGKFDLPSEIPRDERGRIRWSVLRDDAVLLQQMIRSEAYQFYQQEKGISQSSLFKNGRGDLGNAISRFYPGKMNQLKIDLGETLTMFHWSDLKDDPEKLRSTIEQEAQKAHQAGINFDVRGLRENGYGGLVGAIYRFYPGGLTAVMEGLGMETQRKPKGFWTVERIKTDAVAHYEREGTLTAVSLSNSGNSSLNNAIYRHYPGSRRQLVLDLGLPIPTKKDSQSGPKLTNDYLRQTLPKIDRETGAYVDENGSSWIPFNVARTKFRFASKYKELYTQGARAMRGLSRRGLPVMLFNEQDIIDIANQVRSLPQPDRKTKRYTDSVGQDWIGLTAFCKEVKMNNKSVKGDLEGVRTLEGRDVTGRPTLLYNEEDLRNKFMRPRAERGEGVYIDDDGLAWVPQRYFTIQFGINYFTLNRLLETVPRIEGKDSGGRPTSLLNKEAAEEALEDFLNRPVVQEAALACYTDADGEEWVSMAKLAKDFGINSVTLYKYKIHAIEGISGKTKGGNVVKLYKKSEAMRIVNEAGLLEREKDKLVISPDEANEQLRRLVEV